MEDSKCWFPRVKQRNTNKHDSLDMVYFGRETAWQPTEGTVPGPDPRHKVSALDMQNDADEDDT